MLRSKKRIFEKAVSATLSPYALGHSIGIAGVIVLLFYAVIVWFGAYSGELIVGKYPLPFSFSDWTIIVGLIETYVFGYVTGWIIANIYNKKLSN